MTEAKSGKCKSVQNVNREKIDASDNEGEWYCYKNEKHFRVVSVSTWQYKKNQYLKLIDPRCAICYAHVGYEVSVTKGIVCGRCNAYCVCYGCQKNYSGDRDYLMKMHRAKRVGKSSSECTSTLYKVANGELTMKRLPSFFIAFKRRSSVRVQREWYAKYVLLVRMAASLETAMSQRNLVLLVRTILMSTYLFSESSR